MKTWPIRPNLAVSLHVPDSSRRASIMPVEASYPLDELMQSLKSYPLEGGRQLTIEYLLIKDFNDALEDAERLARLLKPLDAKVNLIPLNPDPVLGADMQPPSPSRVTAFSDRLRNLGLTTTERQRRGDGVQAACGQLRASHRDPRGFRS